jgi:Ca2+-binding EF-hand superfamily protein
MIPNQTEEQILVRYFKYFDLENTGLASLRDFIKTIEKIGVVLSKIHDITDVFNYYDPEGSGYIDYKKYATKIFSQEEPIRKSNGKVKANGSSTNLGNTDLSR